MKFETWLAGGDRVSVREIGELQARCWTFWFDTRERSLILDVYTEEERATKRHKFRVIRGYSRLGLGGRHLYRMTLSEAPLPPDVMAAAHRAFVDSVVVRKERG